ncbi:MAG: hypothetical protein JO180_11995 [Gemmatirosa sp.]|nr:hypothetical protein [Gemmatirosa sp.]
MRHMLFAASLGGVLLLAGTALSAQNVPASRPVPGRALLDFPLGTLGEAPALSVGGGGGLFDPASILLTPISRLRLSLAQLDAPGDRSVHGQVGTVTGRAGPSTAVGVSFARMAVGGLDRTGSGDPTVLGSVPYSTYVVSLLAAQRFGGPFRQHLVIGAAGRYRAANADTVSASTGAVDVGAVVDRLFGKYDGRLALSSYLWRPGEEATEALGVHAAADARVAGKEDAHEARIGVGRDLTRGGPRETFVYAAGRWSFAEARLGRARQVNFGSRPTTMIRFGLGFHSERFVVGVGREDSSVGLGPMYQFSLTTLIN